MRRAALSAPGGCTGLAAGSLPGSVPGCLPVRHPHNKRRGILCALHKIPRRPAVPRPIFRPGVRGRPERVPPLRLCGERIRMFVAYNVRRYRVAVRGAGRVPQHFPTSVPVLLYMTKVEFR